MGPRTGPQAAGLGPGGNDALERNVARLFRHHVGIAREVEFSTPSLVGGMRHKGTLIWQLDPCSQPKGESWDDGGHNTNRKTRGTCPACLLAVASANMNFERNDDLIKQCFVAGMVRSGLKSLCEGVRLQTLGRAGLQQLQVDVHYLRPQLRR